MCNQATSLITFLGGITEEDWGSPEGELRNNIHLIEKTSGRVSASSHQCIHIGIQRGGAHRSRAAFRRHLHTKQRKKGTNREGKNLKKIELQ
ncbi:hypothetical protein IEQ34_001353 [Dendrobium chrysotoxum]|uniref:Uncharacterized protein n=1 Tax=Dendrobium chrysotoxum TaxID=161865 RepID=A0AAV7HNV4_DENCH|nr:hypothetical protein IEQ34_001353 [Dendrobium chrysotoxum]